MASGSGAYKGVSKGKKSTNSKAKQRSKPVVTKLRTASEAGTPF